MQANVRRWWNGRRVVMILGIGMPLVFGWNAGNGEGLPAGYQRLPDDVRDALIKEGLGEAPFLVVGINNKGETVTFVPSNVKILDELTVGFDEKSNQHEANTTSFLRLEGSNRGLVCHIPPPLGSPCRGLEQK
jgi:hypothetical protein